MWSDRLYGRWASPMTRCPNCGTHEPLKIVRRVYADATIDFYNCRRCDFSTWNESEYLTRIDPTTARKR